MAKKKQYVEEGIFSIYPDYPILIKSDVIWEEKETPLHFHYYLEIAYCVEGCGMLSSNNRFYEVGAGDITIAAANILHTTRAKDCTQTRCVNLYVDLEDLLKLFPRGEMRTNLNVVNESLQDIYCLRGENHADIVWLVGEIVRLNQEKAQNYKAQTIGLLYALVFKIYDIFAEKKGQTGMVGQLPIMPAIEYIYEHYMEPVKVKDLAKICHFSESHFRKVFLEMKGMQPMEYLNSIRIREARRMLLNSTDTIRVIGEKCGYSSVTTFERNFKQRTGMLPSQWRESQRNPRKKDKEVHDIKRMYHYE